MLSIATLLAEKAIYKRIGMALQDGDKITQADALCYPFCTSRLSDSIFKLRKAGWKIETEMIKVKCGDNHIAIVARYKI